MKKTVSLVIMGEPFEITLEEEFFEFVKEDLAKLQNIKAPKELLYFFLNQKKSHFKIEKRIAEIIKKLDSI